MWTPKRFLTYLRWAWLIEGGAQYFTGQIGLFRAAVITRLREGERPTFPPNRRDALILGGTVFDLLAHHVGPEACVRMVQRLHRDGARGSLELAFGTRMGVIEKAWRMYLDEILYPQSDSLSSDTLEEAIERPNIDLELGTPPEFSFDPTQPRPSAEAEDIAAQGRRVSRRDGEEDVDHQGPDSNGH